jgi:hypothetical protein
MKTEKAYYKDGKFWFLEGDQWPVEPEYCTDFGDIIILCGNTLCRCDNQLRAYRANLSSSLSKAVEFEDQEAIWKLIFPFKVRDIRNDKEGLYSIPEQEVEVVTVMSPGWMPSYNNPDNSGCETPSEPMLVARILPSHTKEENKQPI